LFHIISVNMLPYLGISPTNDEIQTVEVNLRGSLVNFRIFRAGKQFPICSSLEQ
jgi:hypothetical protein